MPMFSSLQAFITLIAISRELRLHTIRDLVAHKNLRLVPALRSDYHYVSSPPGGETLYAD